MATTKTKPLSTRVKTEIALTIERRAAQLGYSESKYLAVLLEKWANDGFPYITQLDQWADEIAKKKHSTK